MARRKNRYSARNRALMRALRSLVAIIVLSALVLGIAYSVREISALDVAKVARISGPLLDKFGVDENQVGEVAGKFISRFSDIKSDGDSEKPGAYEKEGSVFDQQHSDNLNADNEGSLLFSVAILADSHVTDDPADYQVNKEAFKKALDLSKERKVNTVFHVGDITNLGVVEDLRSSKDILDSSGHVYYALPGDRDLWQSVGADNFIKVFGKNYHSMSIKGYKFVLLDNSANYMTIPEDTFKWFKEEVKGADFVLLSQPLFTQGLSYPFNMMYMGSTQEATQNDEMFKLQEGVRTQRDELLSLIRESDVKAVIAGDHHRSSSIDDDVKDGLKHYAVGAVAGVAKELSQKLLQSQSFSLLKVYEDGSYRVENVLLE